MKRLKKGKPISDYQTINLLNATLDAEETQLKVRTHDPTIYRVTCWTCRFTSGTFHGRS